ncbi:MAG: ATP-binding protein [Cloacibacillus sp.]
MQNSGAVPSQLNDCQYQLDLYRASKLGGVFSVRLDDDFTLLYGNDRYYDIHEYTAEEMQNRLHNRSGEYIYPQDLPPVRRAIEGALERKERYLEWEMRIVTGRGSIRHILCSGLVEEVNGAAVMNGVVMDITAQKEAEQALRESEEKFRIATENSDVVFWSYNIGRGEIVQNESSQKVHGFTPVIENVPHSLLEEGYIRPDCIKRFMEMYSDLEGGAKRAGGDFWTKNLTRDGWWCERIEYTTVFDESGRPKCAHAIGRDVTAEKLAETRYNEEVSYKNAIISQNFIGSMRANISTGEIEEVVSPFEWFKTIYAGKDYERGLASLCMRLPDKKQRSSFLAAVQPEALINDFKNGITSRDFRLQRRMESGVFKWTSTTVKLFKKPNSEHIVCFLYTYDTDREEISKRAMEQIADSSYDIIGCIHGANDSYTMLSSPRDACDFTLPRYEQAMAAFLLAHKSEHLAPQSVTVKKILEALDEKNVYSLSFTQRNAEGRVRSKQLRFSFIERQTRTILFTVSDFTEVVNKEKTRQETLKKALAAAEKANAAKSDFLSRMSHDIRTPMNGIIGLTNLTLDLPELTGEARANLVAMKSASGYLLSLINDTLDMNRIESSKLTLNPEDIRATQLIDEVSASIAPMMREKHIDFQIKKINTQPTVARMDKVRFQQIFINILSNAAKFTPEGGKIEWLIECLSRDEKFSRLKLTVRDSGIGISPDFLPKIFEPFEQERRDISSNYMGTGLGMSIVKNLVEKMNGRIEVTSTLGKGTDVIVYLDFERVQGVLPDEEQNSSSADLSGRRILICEDHPLNMQIARRLLEKNGVLVTCATNGQEGVETFAGSQLGFFDAILMDIRMPVMDGLEAARNIRRQPRKDAAHIPIIAMTANAFDDDIKKSKEAGMDAHITKPFDPKRLCRELYSLITKEEGRRLKSEQHKTDN